MSFFSSLTLFFEARSSLNMGLSLNLELSTPARLCGQRIPQDSSPVLGLQVHTVISISDVVLRIQTGALMLVRQEIHPPSHLPVP